MLYHLEFLYYLLFRLRFFTIKKGSFVETHSFDKNKMIKGVVTGFNFGRVTSWLDFYVMAEVQLFEPVQGYDSRFFMDGSYELKDIKNGLLNHSKDKNKVLISEDYETNLHVPNRFS